MEGLVKGLINVALDQIQGHDDNGDRDRNRNRNDDGRDERSRSTWAQVAAGETDNSDGSSQEEQRRNGRNDEQQSGEQRRYRRNDERQSDEQRRYGRDDEQGEQTRYGRNDEQQSSEQKRYGRNDEQQSGEQRRYGRNDEWQSGEPISQKVQEGDGGNDGWETVGKKPSKEHHKVNKDQWNKYKRPVDEQEYSSEVDCGADIKPTEEELSDLSKALNKLWELDLNRLTPGRDYEIDCGEGKKAYQKDDMAEGCLFSWLSEEVFRKPTYSRFCCLLDNYNPHEGYKEVVTPQEREEQAAFVEEISRTAPIKYLHRYLSAKGIASENLRDFKSMMVSLWFDLCGRGGTSGSSSAFEHVFVGEIKQRGEQSVSGFHNWIQFYLEEAKGRVDYQGYIFPRRRGNVPDSETQLLTIQFEWNGVLKSVSSTLIGVSPEFELAIYTLCFYLGREENHVELGPYPVNIKCYHLGNTIGSAFPVADC